VRRVVGALAGFIVCSVLAGFVVALGALPAVSVAAHGMNVELSAFAALPTDLKIPHLDQTTTFYARKDGKFVRIARFFAQNRVAASWNDVSWTIKNAVLGAEDPNYYHEGAISVRGTVRAAVETFLKGNVQGGSTITQQYVKNVRTQLCAEEYAPLPGASKTVTRSLAAKMKACNLGAEGLTLGRKIQEMRYATALEKKYSKNQILLGYLNIAFFGGQTYGIQAAARYYFDTDAAHVTLAQAATLAAMINEPNVLRIDETASQNHANSAANGFDLTRQRRDYVLAQMLRYHMISPAQHDKAVAAPIHPKITPVHSGCFSADHYHAGFFCSYAAHELVNIPALGKTPAQRIQALQRGGLKVYTTLDLKLQQSAHSALSDYVPPTRPGIDLGGAQVALKVGTGEIVSMVQNRAYNDRSHPPPGTTSVNYAADFDAGGSAGFQTGSSFKPFVLAAWLEAGHTLSQVVSANNHYFPARDFHSSCSHGWNSWNVANSSPGEGGMMSVLEATERSVNSAYAAIESRLDLCKVTHIAKSLLVHSASPNTNPWQTVPSMVLGTNYVSPLTMATAYAAFANNGVVCTPVAISRIVGADGKDIPAPATTCSQAIPPNIANTIAYALQKVITSGSGTAVTANPHDGVPILAKTGTTDHLHQNWLVTSTTNVASALWIGNIRGATSMLNMFFQNRGKGPRFNGMYVKFAVGKRILHAIDQDYGGTAFPAGDRALIGGAAHHSYPTYHSYPSYPWRPGRPAARPSAPPAPTRPSAPPAPTRPSAPPAPTRSPASSPQHSSPRGHLHSSHGGPHNTG
jgi:membrane peptidoglycan carboxypeptidase